MVIKSVNIWSMKMKEGGGRCDVMSDTMGWKGEIENVYFLSEGGQ